MSTADPELRPPDTPRALRQIAEAAARAGGAVALSRFGRPHDVQLKADRSEVTDADLAAERAVVDCICSQRHGDLLIGEEATADACEPCCAGEDRGRASTPGAPRVHWAIDPIDGTRNYIRGVPLYACSVAAMVDGVPVAGAIYDPSRDRMVAAARGEGVFVNGEPLPAQAPREHSESGPGQLIIAIPSIRDEQAIGCVHTWIDRFVVRNLGTTALNLALVATGGFDAALATNAKLWDVAAGWVLITEAGGVMTTPRGEPLFPLNPDPYGRDNTPALAALDADVHARLVVG